MHSDVTGLPFVTGEFDNAPVLGAAILGILLLHYYIGLLAVE
jgi:ribulose kinase